MSAGILYIISAPSGAGKTSLIRALKNELENVHISISCTTRPMRSGEKEGIDYYFVDDDQFASMIKREEFLEHAFVFGRYYGTPKCAVESSLKQGKDVILEIDWQGAQQVRATIESAKKLVSIFIFPPSKTDLRSRIIERKKDSEEEIQKRLATASEELQHCLEYDYFVVNDSFDAALLDLKSIFCAERLKWFRKQKAIKPILAQYK